MPAVTVGNHNEARCRGFFVIAGSLDTFKQVLLELPRWSSHRLYCIIWRTDVEELQYMLEEEVHIFADAEAMVFVYGKWTYGLKLGQPNREFEFIQNFSIADNMTWEVNFDGYGQFGGREIRFTTSNCSIFSQTGSGRNLSEFSGFDWWIFAEITRRMNVTPRFVEPDFEPSSNCADNRDDGDCGSFVGEVVNGSWVGGTIGTVFDGDADMTFCGNWIESSKINPGIEISVPVQIICVKYLVTHPVRSMESWLAVFTPFTGTLWLCLGITIIVYSSILTLTARTMRKTLPYRAKFLESWDDSLLVAFGTLVQGLWPKSRRNQGPASWVIFGFLVATSFSGKLFAHLSKPNFALKPTTVKELLQMRYVWPEMRFFPIDRLLSMEDKNNLLWAEGQLIVGSRAEYLDELKKPHRVIPGTEIWGAFFPFGADPIPDEILENYETMSTCISEVYEGFIYRKGSPFNRDFDFYLQQLRESGMIGKYARNAIAEAIAEFPVLGWLKYGIAQTSSGYHALCMADLQGIFEILAVGQSVSMATTKQLFVVSCILGLTAAQYGPPKQSGPVKHRTTTTTQIPPSANEIFPEGGDSVYQPSPGYQPPSQPQQPGDTGGFHLITGSNPSQQPGGFPSQQPQPGGFPSPQPQPGSYPSQQPGGFPSQQPGGFPSQQPQPGGFPSQQPQPGGFPSQQPKPGSYPSQQPPSPPGSVAVKPVDISDNPFINAGISGKPVTSPPYRPPAPAQPQPAPPSYPSPPQAAPQPQPGGPQPGYPKPPSSGSFQPQPQPGGPQPGYPKPPSSGSLQPQQPARPINIQGNPFLSGAIKPSQQPSPGYPAQPSPGYPSQPSPGYPAQPSPGYPAQPSPNPQPPPFKPQPSSPGLPQPPPFRPLPPNQPGQPDESAYKPGQVSQQPPQLGRPVASGYPNQPSPGYPNQQSPGAPNQPGQGAGPQCYGQGRFCVPAASCSNGVIIGTSAPQSIYKPGQCTPGQVCCSAPQPPSRPQPYSPGFVTDSPVNKYTGPLNTTPPPECAAALKCVPEIYCDEIGVMRDLPVVLTREQQENKVALSDCQNLETGVIGKCCRDPNYKDPWPAGMMMPGGMPAGTPGAFDDGQYKPGSFDDGQYNPGASNAGQYNPPGAPAGGKPTISPPNPYTIKKPLGVFGGNVTPYPVPSAQQPAPLAPKPGQTHQDVFPNNEDKSPSTYPQTAGPQSHPVPSPVNVPGPQRNPTSPYGTSVTPEASEAIRFPTEAAQQPPLALPGTYRPPPGAAGPGSQAPSAPSYGQPSAPSYGQPSAPSYGQPSAPSYGQPSAPGYGSPSPQPSSDSQVTPGQQCGVRRPVPPTQADETGFGEFPWHAVVQTAYNGSSLCSAVIIAPNAVLTSAHCIQGFPADKLIVQAGLWKIGEIGQKPVQTLVVTVSAVHPAYNGGSLVKDQAVLVTDTPFQWDQHIDKVCLPASSSQDYVPKTSTCYVTGFGRPALQDSTVGTILHKVPVTIIPRDQCENNLKQTHLGKFFKLNQGFACAAPINEAELCKIDVGSPLVCDRGDGQYELAGVYSWDTKCTSSLPGVLASPDSDWINQVLAKPIDVLRAEATAARPADHLPEDVEEKPGFALGYGRR
ncbi:Tryp_SPc [Nesidiocoris tenuis]|uniref:Tryp_SPc n=1 Tax=Nesidiocoris tenuis TaxID=355587 RepID=A0ABN7AZM8_9HEMI|nr:Tryp_SPc [Nesidiocoris tenuis]